MARKRSRAAGALLAAVLVLGCACILGAAAVQSGLGALGPPSPYLSDVERTSLGLYLLANQRSLEEPAGAPLRSGILDVEPGMDAGSVADELLRLGVLTRPELLTRYLRYRGLDTGIDAGRYQVSSGMSIVELAELLQDARDSRYTLTVVEGWRRTEIAQAIGALGLGFSAGDFLLASRRPPPAWTEAPAGVADLEGFLFPDTYRLDPQMSAEQVVSLMLDAFEQQLDPELRSGFERQGLSVFEGVVLASIVEREAALADERLLIASVFLNRLAQGIPLQADPTVQYALGPQPDGAWWKAALTADDLQIDSPFNTYRYGGLPPGPIASPGRSSLESVASPAQTDYLFFRAACDGSGRHLFAASFEEHLANACP